MDTSAQTRDPTQLHDSISVQIDAHDETERLRTPEQNQSLDLYDGVGIADPVSLPESLASSVTSSPSLNAAESFLAYTGTNSVNNSTEKLKFSNSAMRFNEEASTYPYKNVPTALDSPGTPELPLFSLNSGNPSQTNTPKLESSFGSLGSPYRGAPKVAGSLASVDDEISLTADVSSLHQPASSTSPMAINIDADVYSDSDGGRDGYPSIHSPLFYSSALELEGPSNATPSARRSRKLTQINVLTPPPATKARKPARRKSRNSEANSEKSHRSEFHLGSGYTQTPTSGKIFRNLLILEESLRQQVIQQRTLRRKYVTFLAVLCSLIAGLTHHLYVSEYRGPFRVLLQLLLLMLVVTLLLYHLSGEYQKTIVLPRKFLSSTNKGLRQLNVRLMKIKTTYTGTTADLTREIGLFLCSMALKFCHTAFPSMIQNPNSKLEIWLVLAQLRCQPRFGLNDVKLVLIPRSFSTDIREGWELYRNEFWVNEGVRRRNAALDFTKPKVTKKTTKDKPRKRRPSAPPLLNLSERNLQLMDQSPEALKFSSVRQ
ncbi:hypothetical protein PUMCH_003512 [Australozyma saopauloensis]|uniref:Sporulation-specific protein SPO7 n=1 Tax=Australozyma saopauloensis TaxID=291208 RepID=A0AAX4HCZ3_9ASCO|nr:hypothetical protein PUMCH_003512 [[Candida] saopauloensis]